MSMLSLLLQTPRSIFYLFVVAVWALMIMAGPLQASVLITEFLASNSQGVQDEDGSRPDWIEIHNPTSQSIDLNGWFLTDNANNKVKWRFPPVLLHAGNYLVVFASNKDRRVPGQPLHTNFALSAGGEYLGLIQPDGVTIAHEFSPAFPPQFTDISYGLPSNVERIIVLPETSSGRWIVPSGASTPAATWRDLAFDDAAWNVAVQGMGYDRNTSGVNFLPQIGAGGNMELAMYGIRRTCYVRLPFSMLADTLPSRLTLRVKYDDGFAAYLNGQPLLSGGVHVRRNAPITLDWESQATATHEDVDAITFVDIDVSSSIGALFAGENILAFQGLNRGFTSSDFLLRAELVADVAVAGGSPAPGFFAVPTPGAANGGVGDLVLPETVNFSRVQGTFTTDFSLVLSGATPGKEIRYTTNGSEPSTSSLLYSSPLLVGASVLIRARVVDPATGASGFVASAHYEKLDSTLSNYGGAGTAFQSALPIVVINNLGGGAIPNDDIYRDTRIHLFDRVGEYAPLNAAPALSTRAGVKVRGSSSAGFPKKSYALEFWGEDGAERPLAVLGMPAESDWALISCYDFDRAFARNAWVYEAFRQTGVWAPRTRIVEVFFNSNGDNLATGDYLGVYVLVENVRNGGRRADITKIEPSDISLPGISGGYIFKVDRKDPDEFGWKTNRGLPINFNMVIHRPKLPSLPSEQSSFLVAAFQAFEDAVFSDAAGGFATRNYLNHIEPVSWIDHNIFNALAKNVDALRLSAFFVKDRGRRIEGGPLWDFDRSADSTDSRDNAFNTWVGTSDATDYFQFAWWQPLFQDPDFRQLFVDRWQLHRSASLSTANIHAILDSHLSEFKTGDADHPARRDYARWYGSATSNVLDTEVAKVKTWLANRADWIDAQFQAPPAVTPPAGLVASGQTITLSIPAGATVYYTMDGRDPRASGGGIAPWAISYTGTPIPITTTSHVVARAWRSGTFSAPATAWSSPQSALFLVGEAYADAVTLRVSALHYNPLAPSAPELAALPELDASDFEWIELRNAGTQPINLEGIRLVAGAPVSALTLPPFTLLPGERGLLVKNRSAFLLRHPDQAARIVAEWPRDKKLDNGGEEVWLLDRNGATLCRFVYDDEGNWPTRADGPGSALEYTGFSSATVEMENPANWRASRTVHGTPGAAGSNMGTRIWINEVLAASVWPQLDAIELFNPGPDALDISGWMLSGVTTALTVEDYQKFSIPANTMLPPGQWVAFTEQDFNPNGGWNPSPGAPSETEFSLSEFSGGRVWLLSADPVTGKLRDFEDMIAFEASLPGISAGRFPDGSATWYPLQHTTLFDTNSPTNPLPSIGASNSTPRFGSIQLSEIHYHPAIGTAEFVEIVNTTEHAQSLDGWSLRGDVDYFFGPSHALASGETMVMVPFNPATSPGNELAFRNTYLLPEAVRLVGPWTPGFSLDDTRGTVRLRRTVPPPLENPFFVTTMIEDEVLYRSTAPWPVGASGTGSAIHRLGIRRWGNDPTAWIITAPTPGREAGGYAGWRHFYFGPSNPHGLPGADPDADALTNHMEYTLGTSPLTADSTPWPWSHENIAGQSSLVLRYSLRRDRNDVSLRAVQSFALPAFSPAANDEFLLHDGWWEHRRAWLPIPHPAPSSGFIGITAEPTTPSP